TPAVAHETIRASGLEPTELDHVLLVGGSTRMPAVAEMLHDLVGKEPEGGISPDEAVAHGAALRAGFILADRAGRQAPFAIQDINSHSLGVVGSESLTGRQRAAIVIPRNTPLPVTCHRVFVTQAPNQSSILVPVVEGESSNPDDCTWVGQVVVRDLPTGLPAKTPIQVRFTYLSNGRLAIDVHVEGVDVAVTHEIIREHAMTQDQLDRWRQHISKVP
ncbi:MAG: Hsp70 family protein, partial [Planctomycetota bacterium]